MATSVFYEPIYFSFSLLIYRVCFSVKTWAADIQYVLYMKLPYIYEKVMNDVMFSGLNNKLFGMHSLSW